MSEWSKPTSPRQRALYSALWNASEAVRDECPKGPHFKSLLAAVHAVWEIGQLEIQAAEAKCSDR